MSQSHFRRTMNSNSDSFSYISLAVHSQCHMKNVWMWWYFMCYYNFYYCILMPRKHFLICSFLKHDFWLLYAANTKNETNRMYMTTYERLDEDLIFILWLYLRTNKQPNWIVPVMIRCFVLLFILSSECSRIQYILTVALGHCCPVICKPDETKSIYTRTRTYTKHKWHKTSFRARSLSLSLFPSLCARWMMTMLIFFFHSSFIVFQFTAIAHCLAFTLLSRTIFAIHNILNRNLELYLAQYVYMAAL